MKLSFSNLCWQTENNEAIYRMMVKYGYFGLEIAPSKIFSSNPYDKLPEALKWIHGLKKEYGFTISSMQSIWYGRKENIFGGMEERNGLIEYTKKAIVFAESIGCKNMVLGCPRNRNIPKGADPSVAIEFFKILGDYAIKHNTVIGIEANPQIYDTNYINNTMSAIDLIQMVGSKGFKLNLDVGTMIQNKEPIDELFGHLEVINHVHISEPMLQLIKRRGLHHELKSVLDRAEYQGFVSIEMGKVDNLDDIENVLKYVKNVYG